MGYNRDDYIRIKTEFSQKYILARERAGQRRSELHAKFPRVWEIDRLLSRTGMDIMGVISSGKDTDAQIAAIKERNEKLLAERGQILREGGYPEDYSDIKYECEKCGDTGFVGTCMCECMRRALVMAGYESSGIGALIRSQSFENFSLDFYRTGGGNADLMKLNVDKLRLFADGFGRDTYKNFLFIGGTGLGKTHLSTSVAKRVIDRGCDVLYVTAVGMIADFESVRFGDGSKAKHDTDRYVDAELLIIDDLGTEVANQFTLSCIYDVVNGRINARRSTIINTNLSSKEIETKYNERIYSRLIGEYYPILFSGTDIRKQKIKAAK
ncbi:MAG: ATP-binding protein [Clostridia bacterium]|nr:ATP-binding protein [Clostridia bacterium]